MSDVYPGLLQYNYTAAKLLSMGSPDYPWSHPGLVKIAVLDGTLYLPGGYIPASYDGLSFHRSSWVP